MSRAMVPALFLLLLVAATASAGPNAGGTLVVHDVGLDASCDEALPDPTECSQIDNEVPAGPPALCPYYYWRVYAAFPEGSSPRLKSLCLGAAFDPTVAVLAGGLIDPINDFEITEGGWPTVSGGGAGIGFGAVQTGVLTPCYWFAGYSYDVGQTGLWTIVPHPSQPMVFADDAFPANEDPIVGLGSLGFGQPGFTPCPGDAGACCLASGECEMLLETECVEQGGEFVGGSCEIVTCGSTPVDETSWGQIKREYR